MSNKHTEAHIPTDDYFIGQLLHKAQKCVANCKKCESIWVAISMESNDGSAWTYNGKRI